MGISAMKNQNALTTMTTATVINESMRRRCVSMALPGTPVQRISYFIGAAKGIMARNTLSVDDVTAMIANCSDSWRKR